MQWSTLNLKILLHKMIAKVLNFIHAIPYPGSAEIFGERWNYIKMEGDIKKNS